LPERFASTWPDVIIACDVRGHGEWLHHCSWPPLQLACAANRLFAHTFQLQTDRQTEGQTSQLGYILHLLPIQAADTKNSYNNNTTTTVASHVFFVLVLYIPVITIFVGSIFDAFYVNIFSHFLKLLCYVGDVHFIRKIFVMVITT